MFVRKFVTDENTTETETKKVETTESLPPIQVANPNDIKHDVLLVESKDVMAQKSQYMKDMLIV